VISDGRAVGGVSAEEVMKLRQVYVLGAGCADWARSPSWRGVWIGGCALVVGCHRICWRLGFCDGSGGEGCGYWRFCLCCGVLVMMALLEDRVAVAMGAVRVWGVTAGLWLFDDVCCRLAGWCDPALLLWVTRQRGRRQVRLRGQGETTVATSTAYLVRRVWQR
jgi:hypothetical protein